MLWIAARGYEASPSDIKQTINLSYRSQLYYSSFLAFCKGLSKLVFPPINLILSTKSTVGIFSLQTTSDSLL